jgi:hypothetical protein
VNLIYSRTERCTHCPAVGYESAITVLLRANQGVNVSLLEQRPFYSAKQVVPAGVVAVEEGTVTAQQLEACSGQLEEAAGTCRPEWPANRDRLLLHSISHNSVTICNAHDCIITVSATVV